MQRVRQALDVWELLCVERQRAITFLPVVVELELAVEAIVEDLLGERHDNLLVYVSLVAGPRRPHRFPHHRLCWMARRLPEEPRHCLSMRVTCI